MKSTFKNISQEKQTRIRNAAFKAFAMDGYESMSTNALVKDLGISKGSLFKYFENKADLYRYLVDYASDSLILHLRDFTPGGHHPVDILCSYAEKEYDYLIDHPIEYHFFKSAVNDLTHPDLIDIARSLTETSRETYSHIFSKIDTQGKQMHLVHDHVAFILTGYNQMFMHSNKDADWASLKEAYLSGLKNHLELVRWEYES